MMKNRIIINSLKFIFLIIFVVIAVGPILSIFHISLQETRSLTGLENPVYSFKNYVYLLTKSDFPKWVFNSLIFAGGVTIIKVFLDTFAGYAFARYKFPGSNLLFGFILVSMMVPFAIIMFPTFLIISKLKLINTYPGLILPMLANPFGIFLMRQFVLTIPTEIEEAARIDGCSEFGLLIKVIMPLCRQGQAVLAIITFMWNWNNLIWPLIATNKPQLFTLTVGMAGFSAKQGTEWGIMTSAVFLSIIPIVLVFLFNQRGFIEGLTMGAVKE